MSVKYPLGVCVNSVQIRGTTRMCGVIGNPVVQSLSPLIHNHLFSFLKLDYVYLPFGVSSEKLSVLLDMLRAVSFVGCNVTIPYKSAVVPFCDELSPLSQLTGTVNTLYHTAEGKLCGTTTDADGFLRALEWDGFSVLGKQVVILGNGGTARTIALVLSDRKIPASLTIVARNHAKSVALAEEIAQKTGVEISITSFDESETDRVLESADLLVNCTPIGMIPHETDTPIDIQKISTQTYLFDAIYNPLETRFLREGYKKGCRGQNGLMMLLFQGLESFRHWTGIVVSPELFSLEELQNCVKRKDT